MYADSKLTKPPLSPGKPLQNKPLFVLATQTQYHL